MEWLRVLVFFFNVRSAVDACDCTRGLHTHTPSQSLHRKVTLGERFLATPDSRTCVNTTPGFLPFQSDALPAALLAAVSTVLQQHLLLYLFSLSARTGREFSSNKVKFAVTKVPFSAANLWRVQAEKAVCGVHRSSLHLCCCKVWREFDPTRVGRGKSAEHLLFVYFAAAKVTSSSQS